MSRVAYTQRERARICHHALGHRPVNNWGDGDLPAPWAAGDIVEYLGGGKDGRLDGFDPGFYVVCTAFSVGEGDAWYFRVSDREKCSDRLHVSYPDRVPESFKEQRIVDFMAPMRLVETADPHGLLLRARMLAEGWAVTG